MSFPQQQQPHYPPAPPPPPSAPQQNHQQQQQQPPQPRFALNQEVFILDSNSSEPTGLTTYLITSNHQFSATGQRLYIMRPNPAGAYRTTENRLLEVGYGNGAEVIRTGEVLPGIVVKRYVVEGWRYYDVKDALGQVNTGVAEPELMRHTGGTFGFVGQV